MRGFLANAVVLAALLVPVGLYAQHRGGFRPSFSGSRGSFSGFATAPRTRPIPRQARPSTAGVPFRISFPSTKGTSLINPGEASCILNPSYSDSFYCRQYHPLGATFGIEPVYPYWMPSGNETAEAPPPPPEAQPDAQLADQVGNLAAQVEMMREDQARRDYGNPPPPLAAEPKPPATVLVYRDGHQVDVQDYAIVGKILWVFSGQATQRVPLADLDLTSTQRVNADRGVDFSTPEIP